MWLLASMCELEHSAFDTVTENILLTFMSSLPLSGPKEHNW
jgi:hypothetical protein